MRGAANNPLFRPPAEADSLILQVDQGCPYNRCAFCGMYRNLPYRRMPVEEARALNRMQPRLLSALRVVPVPGTELHDEIRAGLFIPLTEYEVVRELRVIVESLALTSTVFRANHASNVMPVEARLPRDRAHLLAALARLLASHALDRKTPGRLPMWL